MVNCQRDIISSAVHTFVSIPFVDGPLDTRPYLSLVLSDNRLQVSIRIFNSMDRSIHLIEHCSPPEVIEDNALAQVFFGEFLIRKIDKKGISFFTFDDRPSYLEFSTQSIKVDRFSVVVS